MKRLRLPLTAVCVVTLGWAGSGVARAQHIDVLTLEVNGRLVTGRSDCADSNCTTGQRTLGQRVYAREFDADFFVDNPGFNSPSSATANLPPGSHALPVFSQLSWDFLPMQVDGRTSNLLYWNGLGADGQPGLTPDDVAFGALPGPNYALTMFDVNSKPYVVHESDHALVPGGRVATTNGTGFIHEHNYFLVDDGSGYLGTPPAEGIYLWALQLRMSGLQTSLPFYMVFGTLHSSVESLDDAALPWIEEQLALEGDYNGDGAVNAADYTAWRDTLHQTGSGLAADGSGNDVVDEDDYAVWKEHYGEAADLRIAASTSAGGGSLRDIGTVGVPEPEAARLVLIALAALATQSKRRQRQDRRNH